MEEKHNNGFIKGALTGALVMFLIVALGGGVWYALTQYNAGHQETVVSSKVEKKLEKIQEYIDQKYLYAKDADENALADGLYAGYVDQLGDPYSVYYNEEETEELLQSTSGTYTGIGCLMSQDKKTNVITIIRVFKDSPAEKAGLKANDIINKVDGENIEGEDVSKVVNRIKGESGSSVDIGVLRLETKGEEYQQKKITVTRNQVKTPTVEYKMDDEIGYLSILEFDTITNDQFMEAMDDLESQGMKGLVIDLRNNPGGNLKTVTDMLNRMLPKGISVYTEDRDGKRTEFTCDGKQEFTKPLVVLVNGFSASASEIFAGAVQDYGIGTIMGTTTYGKGVVQQLVDLKDGTMLKLTIAQYFTPKGRNINDVGIEPDVEVEYKSAESDDGWDSQAQKAMDTIKDELK